MNELFFGDGAMLFTITAVIGTIVFGFRMAMMLVGGDAEFDGDVDVDVADVDVGDGDSGAAFKILSLHVVSAVLMGFGWTGLAALKGSGLPWLLSFGIGAVAGVGMGWISAKLMQFVYRLQVSGTMGIAQALFTEGVVYATIPAARNGKGEVRVVIDGRERFYRAVTDGPALVSRSPVRVTAVNDDNTVTVESTQPTNALPKE